MTIDYKNTLNLLNTAFPMKANLAQKELELLDFWEKAEIYGKMQKKTGSIIFCMTGRHMLMVIYILTCP
jgi:isoleucyl-tRNA synthetase